MRRKLMMGVLTLALPAATIALVTSPASAKTKPVPFSGNATGSVKCSGPKLAISFSPALTTANTGADTISVKGVLKNCVTSGSNVTVKLGKITGSFQSSGGCAGLINGTSAQVTLDVQWKGGKTIAGGKATLSDSKLAINGAAPAFDNAGDVGFELPNPGLGGSITGSFGGTSTHESFAYSNTSALAANALCTPTSKTTSKGIKTKPAKGIKKLSVKTGTIIIP